VNPDVWLEPDCLEKLVVRTDEAGKGVSCALLLDYDSDNIQGEGASGFDIFGCMTSGSFHKKINGPFAVAAFFFIRRDLFHRLGGFDEEFFLYNEEMDLSWRAWIAGDSIALICSAKIHHQGASGGDRTMENRTSDTKRFYANRNQILAILKNAHCLLLLLALTQIALITVEAIMGALLVRRFSFLRWSLLNAVGDCWRLRAHIAAERRRIRHFRKRGDIWVLRHFFRFGFGRWLDVKRLLKSGVKIDKAGAMAVKK
jgi:GT2 family glycosyltransferase